MKRFEDPTIEIQNLAIEDVITTSNCEQEGLDSCPNETGRVT